MRGETERGENQYMEQAHQTAEKAKARGYTHVTESPDGGLRFATEGGTNVNSRELAAHPEGFKSINSMEGLDFMAAKLQNIDPSIKTDMLKSEEDETAKPAA